MPQPVPPRPPADLLIIGSGIMGAGVASLVRQHDPTASIVMVDGGPPIGSVPGQHLHDVVERELWERYNQRVASGIQSLYLGVSPSGDIGDSLAGVAPGMYHLRSLGEDATGMPAGALAWNVGGMGVHWTAATPWPWGEETFGIDETEAGLSQWEEDLHQAQRLLHVHQLPFGDTAVNSTVTALLRKLFDPVSAPGRGVQPMPMAVDPVPDGPMHRIGPNRIFPALRTADDPHFTLLPSTLAVELVHQEGTVRGARVRHLPEGDEEVLTARVVVVCADTMRTPQLLFASHIRPPALGRYLNEHAFLTGRVLVDLDRHDVDPTTLVAAREGEWLVNSRWLPHSGPAQPFHGQLMDTVHVDEQNRPLAYSVGLSFYVATELNPDNRLVFSETETDAAGMPKMTVEFGYSAADLELIERARQSQRQAAEALGDFDESTESALLPPGSSLHFTGTVRSGPRDDGTSVCDPAGQVWGFDNLYVAGNGVIPTPVVCNSTLTGMITAVRAARQVVRSLDLGREASSAAAAAGSPSG